MALEGANIYISSAIVVRKFSLHTVHISYSFTCNILMPPGMKYSILMPQEIKYLIRILLETKYSCIGDEIVNTNGRQKIE